MKALRVLVLTPDYPPAIGGIQRLVYDLAHNLPDCEVRVVTQGPGAPVDREDSIAVHRVGALGGVSRRLSLLNLNASSLSQGLRWRPDVIVSGHIVVAPAAAAVARLTNRPYVQLAYGIEITHRPRAARWAFAGAAAVIAISEFTASLVAGCGADPARTHLIPPGITNRVNGAVDVERAHIVVWVARMNERYKGLDVLIRAMGLVRARVPDARLHIVGDGPLRPAAEALAHACVLDENVVFRGRLDDSSRDALLDSASCLAMVSRTAVTGGGEGFGIVYLEAGTHGLAVVAGKSGGAVDAVVDGVTGFLVDPWDHVAVAVAITRLMTDDDLRWEMGEAGRVHVRKFYWDEVGPKIREVLAAAATTA